MGKKMRKKVAEMMKKIRINYTNSTEVALKGPC